VSSLQMVAKALIFRHNPQPDASARSTWPRPVCQVTHQFTFVGLHSHYHIILRGDIGGGVNKLPNILFPINFNGSWTLPVLLALNARAKSNDIAKRHRSHRFDTYFTQISNFIIYFSIAYFLNKTLNCLIYQIFCNVPSKLISQYF